MRQFGGRARLAAALSFALAVGGQATAAPAYAATTVPDRTFPANAAALADVATSIRADVAYAAGYTGKESGSR